MKDLPKAVFNWSGGKDSALALWLLLREGKTEIAHLLTNINRAHDRVSMHGVRRRLMEMQADAMGFSWLTTELPEQATMEEYEKKTLERFQLLRDQGITLSVFGDIFLEDLKAFREQQMKDAGMETRFPIWKRDTKELAELFIETGFKAITVCVDEQKLGADFVGRVIDPQFLEELPDDVDPCGENGEFHSFVFDGPLFRQPVSFRIGEKVLKYYKAPNTSASVEEAQAGFWFCDLLPEE